LFCAAAQYTSFRPASTPDVATHPGGAVIASGALGGGVTAVDVVAATRDTMSPTMPMIRNGGEARRALTTQVSEAILF
jgi:hypothetical protein